MLPAWIDVPVEQSIKVITYKSKTRLKHRTIGYKDKILKEKSISKQYGRLIRLLLMK